MSRPDIRAGRRASSLLLSLLLLAAAESAAARLLAGPLDIDCRQPETLLLTCEYRLLEPPVPTEIQVRAAGQVLPAAAIESYPWPGARTAVMLLIDTSDPGRQPVIEHNRQQIRRLLESTRSHHAWGLANFDSTLRVKAPLGSTAEGIRAEADSLEAKGLTTELYRSLLQAIDVLADSGADRRVIFLFSDGQAEDQAYFHQDVIQSARRHNVVINTLGFPRSVSLSVALQTLRRLSEETGGSFTDAGADFELPQAFFRDAFRNVESGGRFNADLSPLRSADSPIRQVQLVFRLGARDVSAMLPVTPIEPAAPETGPASPAPRPAARPAAASPVTPPARSRLDDWLFYGVPLALGILIVLTIVILGLIFRRSGNNVSAAAAPPPGGKPLAYLIAQDEKATRYPLLTSIFRIGRSRDNELTIDDNSVSRRHAEIQRSSEGKFTLHDRGSLNGVFINSQKVGKQELKEGDIIEIGDIYLRFTESPADFQLEEKTEVQHTQSPRIN